jgi:hypothetical protein
MDDSLERQVWAAAFVARFAEDLQFRRSRHVGGIDDISGFSCAEHADSAVTKLREALNGPDAEYLEPTKKGWWK